VSGNGGVPIIGAKPSDDEVASITFTFSPNGDLHRVDGNLNLTQLLIVSFEAAQLASEMRAAVRMQAAQAAAQMASVRDHLAKEGKHGR
jgi:hypothetical protein